jgi:hypothetical protein
MKDRKKGPLQNKILKWSFFYLILYLIVIYIIDNILPTINAPPVPII